MNKVMRYQIIKPSDMDWKAFGDIIHSIQNEVRYTKNKTTAMYNEWTNYCLEYKKETGTYPKLFDVHGYKIFSGYAYDQLKGKVLLSNTSNFTSYIRDAISVYDTHKVDIIKGLASVSNSNKNQPIDLHNKSIKIEHDITNDSYYVTLSLLSNYGKKEYNLSKGQIKVLIKVADNTSKCIINNCINGIYKISGSQLIRVKNKLFLNLCYGFENKTLDLDRDKIMGIDLGIAVPAYMAFNFDKYKRVSIKDNRIINTKVRLDKELSEAKKFSTFTSEGHGRNKKMKAYQRFSHKSHNMSQTINHIWSKYIVDQAVSNGCGTIQMEDLSKITSNANRFLKNWTYYDLQQKIEYKAKEKGIDFVKINPYKTSQRCSCCGYIDPDNRPEQSVFICKKCGFKINADFNAARNIATKDIDNIIADEMKRDGDVN